jgi:YD repeat-containing protein
LGLTAMEADAQPSTTYVTSMNSQLPGSPEASQIRKYQDYPVSLFTGTPQVSIPIFTATAKGISVPITLSYNAGGGVKVDEVASPAGMGFLMRAGGEITRDQRGAADETDNGFMNRVLPMSFYKYKFDCCIGLGAGGEDRQLWISAMQGFVDLEPDLFYFSFGGYSGKFAYDDSAKKFVCLTDNAHLKITMDIPNTVATVFTIVTDDGNKYIFDKRERSRSQTFNMNGSGGQSQFGPPQTSSWKLGKIINADGTDSVMFTYDAVYYSYYTTGSFMNYKSSGTGSPTRQPLKCFTNNLIEGDSRLSNISGKLFSVDFLEEAAARVDLPGTKALGKIVVKNGVGEVQDIFVLHHSNVERYPPLGLMPVSINLLTQSLRLDSISEYGNSESNPSPLRHAFIYDPKPLPGRLSFAKDWWGYPNFNGYTESLVPAPIINDGQPHDGADRHPDNTRTDAGILTGIRLPTGGTVTYEYEPNTTSTGVPQSTPDQNAILSVEQLISQHLGPNQYFQNQTVNFTIDQPANGATNNWRQGVIADITITPQAPATLGIDANFPDFSINKIKEADGSPINGSLGTFTLVMQTGNRYSVYMPNGRYTMTFNTNNYNQHLPPTMPLNVNGVPYDDGSPQERWAIFKIAYDILNPSTTVNYSCGGVRVKSITTRDPYSNVTNKRRFRYHNPVNNASYGEYIGPSFGNFQEVGQYGQWQVYTGSFNMPGMGSVASNVVYRKVLEEVVDNGVTYRTEHNFTLQTYPYYGSGFPYTPQNDFEVFRGNEYETAWDKYTGSSFTPAKIKKQVFDPLPMTNADPTATFSRLLCGIKCAASSYEQTLVIGGGYAPPFVIPYYFAVGDRLYLKSDTTVTYDLNNSYNGITEWHDYKYGDYNQQPIQVRSGNSDGSVSIQKNYYATDRPDASANAILDATQLPAQLSAANRITMPLATKQYRDAQLVSQQFSYGHFSGSKLLVDSMQQALYSNPLEKEIGVIAYDNAANPLTIALRGSKFRKYIWDTDKNLPLATAVMPTDGFFYFSSFERASDGGTPGNAFSGYNAFQLSGSNTINLISSITLNNLDVYLWATSPSVFINGGALLSTGKTKGNWTLYQKTINGGTGINIAGSALIDQLVILPAGSQFTGNVYDKSARVTAVINDQMSTSFFEYDNFGRMTNVKDEQGNIIKSNAYQYQGPQ